MTAASDKFLDGRNYPVKCFPARTLQHRRKEGAGHWLVAYRKTEEQRYRKLQRRIKETHPKCDNTCPLHDNTLDAFFLLQSHCVDKPSELCSVDISEQKLKSVSQEELKEFVNVAYVDASINALSLDSFSSFVSLKELNLSLNGLCSMTFDAADFPHLKVLDLSFNNLSADAIVSIGWLPRLKDLHLTGNQLSHLPSNLGSSLSDPTKQPATEEDTQFQALEVLMLDDNKLSSAVFNSLKNLQRLKHLNLQGNHITEIPYMQLIGSLKPPVEEKVPDHTQSNPDPEEQFKKISQIGHKEKPCGGSSLPLPTLQYLNLADNKISKEEALLAATLFPSLREINICSNPLTTQRRGDPPLLTYYLQERRGITIKRKKTEGAVTQQVKKSTGLKWRVGLFSALLMLSYYDPSRLYHMKLLLFFFDNFESQVEERNSKVSKKSVSRDTACSAKTQVEKNEKTVKKTPESSQENTEHFFVTQMTDFSPFEISDVKETGKNKNRNKAVNIPEEFLCHEMLMDAKANPGDAEPIGIQTAVQMLEHTLKNLNVYRDSKPKLDSIQTPYKEREKRIQKLPPVKLIKQPLGKVDEMIKEIRASSSIREVSLRRAMCSSGVTRQDHEEAQSLLRDMKTKYKMVHRKTMELVTSTVFERPQPKQS